MTLRLLIMFGLISSAYPALAQDRAVGMQEEDFKGEVNWETLRSSVQATAAKTKLAEMRMEQVDVCSGSNMFYAPGHAEADSRGCLKPYKFVFQNDTCSPPSAACLTGVGTICGSKGSTCAYGSGAGTCGPNYSGGPTWPTTRVLRCE